MVASFATAIRDAVSNAPGPTERGLREAILRRAAEVAGVATPGAEGAIPADIAPLVDKILRHAYKVVDGDIDALRAAGWADDALFDVIVSAAAGAGLARLARGLDLMD